MNSRISLNGSDWLFKDFYGKIGAGVTHTCPRVVTSAVGGLDLFSVAHITIGSSRRQLARRDCQESLQPARCSWPSEEDSRESARCALQHGIPGGGYIFSTSNCIYTGMPLARMPVQVSRSTNRSEHKMKH